MMIFVTATIWKVYKKLCAKQDYCQLLNHRLHCSYHWQN